MLTTIFCSLAANAQQPKTNVKNVKVVNKLDPICGMDNAMSLKDTAIYQKKVYGFCSTHCKTEFKKDPKKYTTAKRK